MSWIQKDYSVQAFIAGEWKDVDKVAGNKEEVITHKFSPVVTDKIRLWITAANGPNSKIAEIEIYEKQSEKYSEKGGRKDAQ